ncbi:MAG: YidC/Oxa1 family membrane protein insertase [Clostridia bacterium]|nr:YidC/Oxa1 family membrane protein insertase [Clostridia bacterium]
MKKVNFLNNFAILAAVGFWQAIKDFFANAIEWLFNLTNTLGMPSYILAIFIFTVIIRLLIQPLMGKQMRSTRKMQLLAPEVEELKKKYANNQQKQQQLTMELYKEHGASPLSGCLPLLIQMPILFALFDALRKFGQGGVHPLHPEYFKFWVWTDLSVAVKDAPYSLLLPLIAAGATFLQQYLTTANRQDKQQRMMLILFPVMFFFMMRSFPVLMAFYWIFYSLIGAAIMFPILRHWSKVDQAEIEMKRAQKQAEEEEKRAKKAAAKKEAARAAKAAKNAKPAAAGETGAQEADDEAGLPEHERKFREWLREQDYTLKIKKMKLHPYSLEAEPVLQVFDEKGKQVSVGNLRSEYESSQRMAEAPTSLGEMFGFGRKKKTAQQEQKTPAPHDSAAIAAADQAEEDEGASEAGSENVNSKQED